MHHFHYRNGILHAEDVDLARLVADTGTPAYVYSSATLERHMRVFRAAFAPLPVDIFYAMKANGNLSVLRTVARLGGGVDVVSEGEIRKALAAGVPAERIVFSGVGKSDGELHYAVSRNIQQINVETPGELYRLSAIAGALRRSVNTVLRINPAIGAGAHAKITTGDESNKFGISHADALRLYGEGTRLPGILMRGFAVHIGSQIFDLDQPEEAFGRLVELVRAARAAGYNVTHLDLGGGLGVHYDAREAGSEDEGRVKTYAAMVRRVTHGLDVHLGFEPGRVIIANAGILLARVVALNVRAERTFVVLDAGMNDLVRPAMYDAHHDIWPLQQHSDAARQPYDVVGPIYESSDSFAVQRLLPPLEIGAFVAFMSAGAYGASMSSTYNQRLLVPEILVDGPRYAVIRPRQTYEELIGLDRLAPWLTEG